MNYIVEHTLGPLCQQITDQLKFEIDEAELKAAKGDADANTRLARLKGEYDDRLLKLRVLDPAMGSGHFLLRACSYLAEQIATHPWTADEGAGVATDESSLTYWKRRVSETCLYGVDLNDMAVELAKLAMWLETVAIDRPLTFLDHHFRTGNSLVGAKLNSLTTLPEAPKLLSKPFERALAEKIPALLRPLAEIEKIPSSETSLVKQKGRLLTELERARAPFRDIADVWCSSFVLPDDKRIHVEDYRELIEEISRPRKFSEVLGREPFARALQASSDAFSRCFHWELEFPEVFFDAVASIEATAPDSNPLTVNRRAGFHAVIGNPPYDVLSELETGRDLAAFKSFLEAQPLYEPSFRGKNNLYKLFVCRALDLLASDGYFGFITPMAILGDDQAAGLRRALLSAGTFTVIDAFPQKDDPHRRVFAEAKLSTAVFVLRSCNSDTANTLQFTSRVHPGRELESDSPTLRMHRCDIPLYDPSNFTLISCAQADLDLAVRIMQSGRMRRLHDVAESFQGEINETNDRKRRLISYDEADGPEIVRGAHICMYGVREASQGTPVYLLRDEFLAKRTTGKALDYRHTRIGFQRKSPQNNFRRLIAAQIPQGTFLLESVSYVPANRCKVQLPLVLAILNSQIADWYFRLGSTNAMVAEYQFNNLPFPRFAEAPVLGTEGIVHRVIDALSSSTDGVERAWNCIAELTFDPPFDPAVADVLVAAVQQIEVIEAARGEISRSERSELARAAQPFQDFIDRVLFALAGLTDDEAAGLKDRLSRML